jgi:hypothetical protein
VCARARSRVFSYAHHDLHPATPCLLPVRWPWGLPLTYSLQEEQALAKEGGCLRICHHGKDHVPHAHVMSCKLFGQPSHLDTSTWAGGLIRHVHHQYRWCTCHRAGLMHSVLQCAEPKIPKTMTQTLAGLKCCCISVTFRACARLHMRISGHAEQLFSWFHTPHCTAHQHPPHQCVVVVVAEGGGALSGVSPVSHQPTPPQPNRPTLSPATCPNSLHKRQHGLPHHVPGRQTGH